ncbi:SLAP domain-containing protein [Pradoshia sp. D12]|uniref:SLAP domain-containing protein n=1 Tax=Bacillaceae TaxID=186817 RepID=UPI00112B4803|nr:MULTISPECIES: SLAP domain-containing protein [Bacillaceae]QFK70039.1 SLAP domain-containing protein [Pradoshia sp. D12]TPF70599.1 SLAP domain-containing protein [Bacillus sp. D12]
MQHLQFEKSWDKALSAQDRSYIEKVFVETKHLNGTGVIFSPIREAINHKEALLVTVLVHNFTDQPLTFNNTRLRYKIQGEVIAENEFTLPKLVIPNEVSMPWTFIFPKESYKPQIPIKNGRLEVV